MLPAVYRFTFLDAPQMNRHTTRSSVHVPASCTPDLRSYVPIRKNALRLGVAVGAVEDRSGEVALMLDRHPQNMHVSQSEAYS